MVNFGPLAAEIRLVVWGTPANFNEFRILPALLHGTPVVGISQTASLLTVLSMAFDDHKTHHKLSSTHSVTFLRPLELLTNQKI